MTHLIYPTTNFKAIEQISIDRGDGCYVWDTEGIIPKKNRSFLADPKINKMDLSEVDFDYKAPDLSRFKNMDMGLEGYMPMKKGGRVGCGIAKKGFGKAMKKRSK